MLRNFGIGIVPVIIYLLCWPFYLFTMINKSTYIIILLFCLVACSPALGLEGSDHKPNIPDNEQLLLNTLASELIDELSGLEFESPFYLRTNLSSRQHRFIVDKLVDHGYELKATDNSPANVVEVEIEPVFTLERLSRNSALRSLEMDYSVHLINQDDIIQENLRGEVAVSDTVDYGNKERLVTDWPATRFTNVTDSSRWRWVTAAAEPAVLIGATAVAIVLLYNTRSN